MDYRDAAREAVEQCIREGVLAEYLTKHRQEAEEMLFTVQDEERALRVHWKAVEREVRERGFNQGYAQGFSQGREEGRQEGRKEGRLVGREGGHLDGWLEGYEEAMVGNLNALMASVGCDLEAAMNMLNVPEDARSGIASAIKASSAD